MVSDSKKFIFLHLQKTGGSSIEYSLREFANDEIVVSNDNTEIVDKHVTFYKKNSRWKSLEDMFTTKELASYYKFTIVRNPWDRMVSWWKWSLKEDVFGYEITFEDFLLIDEFRLWKIPQLDNLMDSKGVVNVDFIGRFENLDEDIKQVINTLEIESFNLPKINAVPRNHYSEYYTDETIEIVRQMHLRDIEYFDYEFNDQRKIKNNISYNVFYHDEKKLEEVTKNVKNNRFHYINLNEIPLPEYLKIDSLSDIENRAMYSEYLGLLTIAPETDILGFFTYSIPIKFSSEWAIETEYEELFIPEINFSDFNGINYDKDYLYAVELKDPKSKFSKEINDIHKNFGVGSKEISQYGPYKGSFITTKESFLKFQVWFKEVTIYLLNKYEIDSWGYENSQFSSSDHASKSKEYLKIDKLRHGLGEVLERCVAYYFAQIYHENNKVMLGDYLYKYNKDKKLRDMFQEIKIDNNIIIAVANNAYQDILDNWIFQMKKLGINNFLVIALDKKLYVHLKKNNVNTFFDPLDINNIIDLWRKRIEIYKKTVRMGVNLIHSDPDAVWLKNPMKYFTNKTTDLIFSQGTYWPNDIHGKWGFVLCCGLFYATSSKKNIKLFNRMLEVLDQEGDDQAAVNRLLDLDEIKWSIKSSYNIKFNKKILLASEDMISGKGKTYTVDVLPQHLFQRLHNVKKKAYVKHIYSGKSNESTKEVLQSCGCYFIEKNSEHKIKRILRKIKNKLKTYVVK